MTGGRNFVQIRGALSEYGIRSKEIENTQILTNHTGNATAVNCLQKIDPNHPKYNRWVQLTWMDFVIKTSQEHLPWLPPGVAPWPRGEPFSPSPSASHWALWPSRATAGPGGEDTIWVWLKSSRHGLVGGFNHVWKILVNWGDYFQYMDKMFQTTN